MSMHLRRAIFVIAFAGLFALVFAGAQQRPSASTGTPQGTPTAAKGPAGQKAEPCWEQAGIPKSVMEQRRSIQASTRSQIQAVCSEIDLSEQQKREKIHQIRQAAQENVNALISPAQRQQLEACQRGREVNTPHAVGPHPAGDPCAGLRR
jgi:hypothetical protein